MKQSRQSFSNFTIYACLLLMLAAIILKIFLDDSVWRMLIAVVSVSSALLAVSDLFKKSADDQRNMYNLSTMILNPLYETFAERNLFNGADGKDLRKERYADETDFERSLRNVNDYRDRAVRELIWERRNNDKRPSRARANSFIRIVFLVLSLLVLVGGLVLLFAFPELFPKLSMYHIDAAIIGSLVIALASSFSAGGNFAYLQRVEMLLGLRDRCQEVLTAGKKPALSEPRPAAVYEPVFKPAPPAAEPKPNDVPTEPAAPTEPEPAPAPEEAPVIWQAEEDLNIPEEP